MAKRNPAEILLDAAAGTLPLVVSGPEGDVYRVPSMKMYLVVRKAPEQAEASAKDLAKEQQTVASHEVWTSNLMVAKHVINPEGSAYSKWLASCRCKKCKAKRAVKSERVRLAARKARLKVKRTTR